MTSLPIVIKYLIVGLISMVPIVELRGAIPIAEGMGLNILLYYPIAILGNMLPVPFIYLFARKILEWGKDKKIIGKFFTWCLQKGEKGGEKLKETAGNSGIFLALLLFVGIPLPGTGAWTGTLAASFLKIDFKTSITAIMLGVLLAGIIMSVGSKIVSILGWPGLIAIIAVIIIAIVVSIVLGKKKNK
ncbi:MAG: small multi-drug export protein [Clostridia bacterium]|nr:small multi-drug export protein [Clostridia bacterium]